MIRSEKWRELTPYERGEVDGLGGKPGPPFPKPDSSWADRLYNRGWEAGAGKRAAEAAEPIKQARQ